MKKRTMTLVVSLLLVALVAVGGTLAWLTDTTQTVTNTFTAGDVDITLTETWNTDADGDGENDSWSAQIVPGSSYVKDPIVTVLDKTNVNCYLFVKFDEIGNPTEYLTYTSMLTAANGWTQGDGTKIPSNVWYRVVESDADVKTWHLLDGDTVMVKTSVTKGDMETADDAKLVYTAYAAQKDNLTPEAAWAEVSK